MGNSFHFAFEFYYGTYAVENLLYHQRAHSLRASRSATSQTVLCALPTGRVRGNAPIIC